MTQYELNFNDYWRILKKKKWLIVFTALMLTFFSIFFTLLNKPTPIYESTASIQIEKNTSLTGLYMESVSWNYGGDLATRAAVIKSYSMIEKAAKNLGLIDSTLTSEEIKNNKRYFKIIEGLKSRVSTEQEGYTNIINIKTRSTDPQIARDFTNALAKTYQEQNFIQKNAKTKNALKALKKQLANAEADYREAEKELQNFRQSHNFMTLEGKSKRLSDSILKLEKELEEITSDISHIDRLIQNLRKNRKNFKYLSLKLLLNNQNNFLLNLQKNLDQYKNDLNRIRQFYTEQHPKVQSLKNQITIIQDNIITELEAFNNSLQKLRIEKTQKLEQVQRQYNQLPILSQNIENLKRELETSRNIYEELKVNYLQSVVKKSENIQEIFFIRPAFLPSSPINSVRVTPTALAGLIIGIVFGIILAFIAETLDTTFRTIDDIEQTLGTTVQGIIPFIDLNELKESLLGTEEKNLSEETLQQRMRLLAHFAPKSTIAESYRSLRTNINFSLMENNYKTIMVTSSVASEGKTTIATNLALSMAQTGLRTLLIEADLRKPRISKTLGINRVPGLTDYILNRESLDGCIRDMSDLLMGSLSHNTMKEDAIPGIEYLNILPAGKIERNPSEIIAGKKLNDLLVQLKTDYDIIIFDSAPVIQATDAVVLGSKVDTNLMVYYQGKISRNTLRRAKNQLEMLKSSVLGIVINGMRSDLSSDYVDYKYKYDYLYSYGDHDTSDKNKLLYNFKNLFIEPESNIHLPFFQRLKKIPLIIAFLFFILLGILGIYMLQGNDSQQRNQPTAVQPQNQQQTPSTQQQDTPKKLKELQQQHIAKTPAENNKVDYNISSTQSSVREKNNKIPDKIIYTGLKSPYTIRYYRSPNKTEAINQLNQIRNKDISAFLTPDYSDPEKKHYCICIDLFKNRQQAEQAIQNLRFSNITGNLKAVYLPYSIKISKQKYDANNYYQFRSFYKGNFIYMAGAFKNISTADIFRKTKSQYQQFSIAKR